MTKRNTSSRARDIPGAASSLSPLPVMPDMRVIKHQKKESKPINKSQEIYLNKINNNIITFSKGPAGTGKTYVAAMAAAKAMQDRKVDRILITRPMVEAGEEMGFLPGDLHEKYYPYVAPFLQALSKIMGSGHVEALVQNGRIEFAPLAYMRGHSWDRSFVIFDEAQNATRAQMKLFLTRIGKDTTVIVDGDTSQKDGQYDGLEDAIERLATVKGVSVHIFTIDDIVRSGIVREVILRYSSEYYEEEHTEDDYSGLQNYLSKE